MTPAIDMLRIHGARLGALLIAIAPVCLQGQATRDASPPSGWATLYPTNIRYAGITPADRAAAVARLQAIERLFRQIPELVNPTEFVVKKQYFGGSRPTTPSNGIAAYTLFLWFFARFGPERQVAGEGCRCIAVTINPDQGTGTTDEQGRGYFIESDAGEPIPGATVTYGQITEEEPDGIVALFTRGGIFPWTTMTREAYLRAQIFEFEGSNGATVRETRQQLEQTPYQQWMSEAAQRKRDRDELATQLQGIKTPEEIRKTIADMEASERETTERLKAGDEEDRRRNQEASAALSRPGDALRAQIAAMSAEERALPARVAKNWQLLAVDAPNGSRILTPTVDFWRARSSPVEIHSILVRIGGSTGDNKARPEVVKALRETYRKLDWAAIKRMVDAPE